MHKTLAKGKYECQVVRNSSKITVIFEKYYSKHQIVHLQNNDTKTYLIPYSALRIKIRIFFSSLEGIFL